MHRPLPVAMLALAVGGCAVRPLDTSPGADHPASPAAPAGAAPLRSRALAEPPPMPTESAAPGGHASPDAPRGHRHHDGGEP